MGFKNRTVLDHILKYTYYRKHVVERILADERPKKEDDRNDNCGT